MCTLIIFNRDRVELPILARYLTDELHTNVTYGLDEQKRATFTADVSIERMDLEATFWLPTGGWYIR